MDWYETVFETIDMRSFSNLWYWISLAVLWSTMSHWVLGVPFDLILRAKKEGPGPAMTDLETLVRVNTNRMFYIADVSGTWLLLFGSAVLTALAISAVAYDFEFAQAVLLLVGPLVIVSFMSLATARRIRREALAGSALIRRLSLHRFLTQLIGVVAILITAIFGMYKNLFTGFGPY